MNKFATFFGVFLILFFHTNAQDSFYAIGNNSYATDISDNGTLVGSINGRPPGWTRGWWGDLGFAFSNGVLTTASGYMGITDQYPAQTVSITAINNSGQWGGLYGSSGVALKFSGTYPVNYHQNEFAYVNAINEAGIMVGVNSQNPKARVWTSTGSSWLVGLDGIRPSNPYMASDVARSAAYDINNSGLIVGDSEPYYTSNGLPRKAVFWQDGNIFSIGTLGGEYSSARSVNNNNLIVGSSDTQSQRHAFSYFNGSLLDLGTLGGNESIALDVNDNAWIVGKSKNTLGEWVGFIYKDNVMYDLNNWLGTTLLDGWTINEAVAINENGQIAANGSKNGASSALIITIPEPSALSLLAVGLGGLAVLRRRRL